jgi:hypothetical protein
MGNFLAPREPEDYKRRHDERLARRPNAGLDEETLQRMLDEPDVGTKRHNLSYLLNIFGYHRK